MHKHFMSDVKETFVAAENRIALTDTLSVEWKPASDAVPDAMSDVIPAQAERVWVDGIAGVRVRTTPGTGWVRLHLAAGGPDQGIMAPRFLCHIRHTGPVARLKPFVTKTNLHTQARREFAGAKGRAIWVACNTWTELSGAYLHRAIQGRFRLDVVVDIPRMADIVLVDVSVGRFDMAAAGCGAEQLADDEVWPIAPFSAKPVDSLPKALDRPAVYASALSLTPDRLSGWVLSQARQMSWHERASGRQGDIALVHHETSGLGALDHRFSPPLEPGSVLHLAASGHADQPLVIEASATGGIGGKPVSAFFDVTQARIQDAQLHVAGDVVHPIYPGMPVRLDLMRGTQVMASRIARGPADPFTALNAGFGADTAFAFTFTVPLRPREAQGPFWLAFSGMDAAPRLGVQPVVARDPAPGEGLRMAVSHMPADGTVTGQVDGWGAASVEGWAVCPEDPESAVEVVLYRDAQPFAYSKSQSYRADLKDHFGSLGFHGFRFDVPPNAALMQDVTFEVRPVGRDLPLIKGAADGGGDVPPGIGARAVLPAPRPWVPKDGGARGARISVIVLNLDGAALLEDLFASCAAEDRAESQVRDQDSGHRDSIEWIVVDHNSTDDSQEVCARHAAQGMDIRFLARRGNYSFSESNNYGVTHATGDIVLFANNDLIFTRGFGARLRAYLRDPQVGALGVRLRDHIDDPRHKDLDIDQHLGVYFERRTSPQGWVRPYEARRCDETDRDTPATRCIAVTGAFLAMRRQDFETIGGFDERYSYGLEDVDLCLKVHSILGQQVVCAHDIDVVHHRGFSRSRDKGYSLRRRRNNDIFTGQWGTTLRRMIKTTGLSDPGHITGSRPVFAFMVADVGDDTAAGEYYTSLEMGRALQKILPCHIRYVPQSGWYDLDGIDVVIAMVNSFDIAKARNASPWLVTVNWMRQWFDRWADDKSLFSYDHLFASSETACAFLTERSGLPVHLLPIASQYHDFANATPKDAWRCDFAFTGSRFGPPREIEFQIEPDRIAGEGKVFGHNWEGTSFAKMSQGPVAYSTIPQVYASARVVLDDANVATKPWGSCNSRVFDTMASGALLLSNGALGCQELFGDLVPTFHDADSLTQALNYWLGDEAARKARVAQMQEVIRTKHTYDVRARALVSRLTGAAPVRIAIKCAAIYAERQQWGDYHYAESLAAALRRLGYVARVDCRESWESGVSASDDVTIVLRGLVRYRPKAHQINLLWLISHPDDISIAEMDGYDHTYVASQFHADSLSDLVPGKVSFLPQCTDTGRFFFDPDDIHTQPDRHLYVANSRGVFRDPVRWAVQDEHDLDIYGIGWQPFVTDARLKGGVIPNQVLGGLYAASRLVICDHWDDMKALGYVSNRVFDVLGAGGRLVVDAVRGLDSLVPADYVDCFDSREAFAAILRGPDRVDLDQRREAADWVARVHSFDARAGVFDARIRTALGAMFPGGDA